MSISKSNVNNLHGMAQFALFVSSYLPLFVLIIVRQVSENIDFLNYYGNSFYLGLKNPSMMDGINVQIEVVAIVEEVDENVEKAAMYCNLGWKAYERGEIDKCLELTKKALEIAPNHCVSKFNIALVNLSQDSESTLDDYITALSGLKNESSKQNILANALADIQKLKESKPLLKYLTDVEELLKSELTKPN